MKSKPSYEVKYTVYLELSETEARALNAIVSYGIDAFLRVFYKHLGKGYLEKHDEGVRKLFEHIWSETNFQLGIIDDTRRNIEKALNKKSK